MQRTYTSFGCYRFLNDEAKTIYVGSSKNIHRRLFSQHFKRGHLDKECYRSTAKIEIIKTYILSYQIFLCSTCWMKKNSGR